MLRLRVACAFAVCIARLRALVRCCVRVCALNVLGSLSLSLSLSPSPSLSLSLSLSLTHSLTQSLSLSHESHITLTALQDADKMKSTIATIASCLVLWVCCDLQLIHEFILALFLAMVRLRAHARCCLRVCLIWMHGAMFLARC